MAKKNRGASITLDSFLDIMTCLVGVLVLIIILTGVDASQIRVLIPTPMMHETDKRPIFIEARNNQLFRLPVSELRQEAASALERIAREAGGDTEKMLTLMQELSPRTDNYEVDMTYSLTGQLAISPLKGPTGYELKDFEKETASDWFGSIVDQMDKEEEMLTFLVRDDSFQVFKIARALAWLEEVEVSYALLSVNQPIKFGLLGERIMAQ